MKNQIKYLFLDIDGALTDAYIYITTDKKGIKKYFRPDLSALAHLRENLGIEVIGLNEIDDYCDHYLKDFGVVDTILIGDKVKNVRTFLENKNIQTEESIYVGINVSLYSLFNYTACPAKNPSNVSIHADIKLESEAGHGAIAELCQDIIKIVNFS